MPSPPSPPCSIQLAVLPHPKKKLKTVTTATTHSIRSPSEPQRRPLAQLSDIPSLTFVKDQKSGRLRPQRPRVKLRNNLLAAVGYIELANAGDFAANVFNMRPIPIYAITLMVIGGTVALGMIYFVIKDTRLSWQNIQGLRAERKFLLQAKQKQVEACNNNKGGRNGGSGRNDDSSARTLECLLHVNYRDLGAEVIDRLGMDVLLGCGALMVGAGTYLAMGGEDPVVFDASNLLTGYIGNSPIAFYGLVNMGWSAFVWLRAKHHGLAVTAASGANLDARVKRRLKRRTRRVQLHGMLNGVAGVVAGAASLVTATHWWAYIILGPCILISGYCNRLWRHHVGYDRPLFMREMEFTEDEVVEALKQVDDVLQRIGYQSHVPSADVEAGLDPIAVLVAESDGSFRCLLEFIAYMNLFGDFCGRLIGDKKLVSHFCPDISCAVVFDAGKLLAVEDLAVADQLLQMSRDIISQDARKYLEYREKWLLEVLGCYMALGSPFKAREEDDDSQTDGAWEVDKS
ncbi:hypothetical protein QBC44DRAFT_385081 [Cladorrhinum sp. PSN332]|nr:hypothetical protein QBC44DRAFT_385081 [Cladorrhinum sp. PSN332]